VVVEEQKGEEFRQQVTPKTSCSDGHGSVRNLEMSSDWGSRKSETGV